MMPSSEATSAAQTVATAERVDTTRPSILQDGPVTNVTPLSTANEGSSTTAILQAGPTSSTSSPTGTVKNEAEGAAVIQSTEPAIVTTTLVQETVSEADASPTIKPNEVVPTISDVHSTKVTITQTEATTTSSDQSDRTTVMTLQSESEISGFTNTVSPIPTQAEVTSTQLPFVPSSTANQTKGTTQTTQGVPGPVFNVTPDTPPSNHTVSPLTEKDLADSTEGMMMTQKTSTDVAITSVGTVVKPSGTTTPRTDKISTAGPIVLQEEQTTISTIGEEEPTADVKNKTGETDIETEVTTAKIDVAFSTTNPSNPTTDDPTIVVVGADKKANANETKGTTHNTTSSNGVLATEKVTNTTEGITMSHEEEVMIIKTTGSPADVTTDTTEEKQTISQLEISTKRTDALIEAARPTEKVTLANGSSNPPEVKPTEISTNPGSGVTITQTEEFAARTDTANTTNGMTEKQDMSTSSTTVLPGVTEELIATNVATQTLLQGEATTAEPVTPNSTATKNQEGPTNGPLITITPIQIVNVTSKPEGVPVVQTTESTMTIATNSSEQESVSVTTGGPSSTKPSQAGPPLIGADSTEAPFTQTEATTASTDQSDRTTERTQQAESATSGFPNTVSTIPAENEGTLTQLPSTSTTSPTVSTETITLAPNSTPGSPTGSTLSTTTLSPTTTPKPIECEYIMK